MGYASYYPFKSQNAKEEYLRYYDARAHALWPKESENRLVETAYGDTFVRITGKEDLPPLVLLPGMKANSLMWGPNIRELSAHYRTYAVDSIIDYGRSRNSRHLRRPSELVDWLKSLLDALALDANINLTGLSYGGWLTALCALRFPERLRKIVLLAPGATVLPIRWQFMAKSALLTIAPQYYAPKMFSWLFADRRALGETGERLLREFVEDVIMGARCFRFRGFINLTVLTDEEWKKLPMPVLFAMGANDKLYSAQEAIARLKRINPKVQTQLIPNAGHEFSAAQAKLVNKLIIDFLR